MLVDEHSHQPYRSTLNQSGIKISADPTVTNPFFQTCILFNSVQYISRNQKCVTCVAEGRKKATYIYCRLCTILSHIKTNRHSSLHTNCMGGKHQFFQRHVEIYFVNQTKKSNTLTQRIIAKHPQVNTVVGPQTFSFQKIKRKSR